MPLKNIILGIFFSTLSFYLSGQSSFNQTIRGVISEKSTQEKLPGANILVVFGEKKMGAVSNETGEFAIKNVPVGRCNITVSMMGYTPYQANNILVSSGKETVLDIALEEIVHELKEVVVAQKVDKEQAMNRLAVVSARMLSSEEANRYAGSWGDPARMVANLAGVAAANDTRNDIIIRGNSPVGLQWRLDGFEIPNPNHFGALGGTGGPVSMLNNNQLANSDFFTGAFPAEFGNVTAGLFDLRLRNGNNRKHEFMASMGFNGVELGAEGPVSKETGASYMINGRYSFLTIMEALGVDFGTGGTPEYRDLSGKINIPLEKGNFSLITLLGASNIHLFSEQEKDQEKVSSNKRTDVNIDVKNSQAFVGANYTHRFNTSTRLENRLSYQIFRQNVVDKHTEFPQNSTHTHFKGETNNARVDYSSNLSIKLNAQNTIKSGIGAIITIADLNNIFKESVALQDYSGSSAMLRAFSQWQYRFDNRISMVSGVYGQYYAMNDDYSIEPRLGLKWSVTPKASLSLGGGTYSQLQPSQVYFYKAEGIEKNRKLKMSKSAQCVLGYNQKIGANLHLKSELYYQYLYNVPVIPDRPAESMLNLGDDYYNNWDIVFVNQGTGRNYGIELTLEKFFSNHYYFLLTTSLYDSKYKGYDEIERHGKFAGNYAINALTGYEWEIGSRNLLSINTKVSYIGGKRFVPMSVEYLQGEPTYDYTQAYTQRLPRYFRLDLNVSMKQNFKSWSVEWFCEIDNITAHKNVSMKYYDRTVKKDKYTYQFGLFPIGGFRLYF